MVYTQFKRVLKSAFIQQGIPQNTAPVVLFTHCMVHCIQMFSNVKIFNQETYFLQTLPLNLVDWYNCTEMNCWPGKLWAQVAPYWQ